MSALWGRLAPYVLGVAGVLLALLTFGASQRRAGAAAERARQTDRTIEAVGVRHEVEDTVRRDPAGAAERLRGRWSRD